MIKLGNLVYSVCALALLHACAAESPEITATQPLDFTIDGKSLASDYVGIPTPTDADVYQAELLTAIQFVDNNKSMDYQRIWMINGASQTMKSHTYARTFTTPGLYKVQLCRNAAVHCVTKYVHVKSAQVAELSEVAGDEDFVEAPVPSKPAVMPTAKTQTVPPPESRQTTAAYDRSISEERRTSDADDRLTEIDDAANAKPAEPEMPAPVSNTKKEPLPAPVTYKIAGEKAGLPLNAYKPECVEWIETGKITLRPRKPVMLDQATVYTSAPGRVTMTLSDDTGQQETITTVLMQGRTSFKFFDLYPELLPGRKYTLSITSIEQASGKPKIANIKSCPQSATSNPDIEVIYGQDLILFDLKYFKA